MIRMKLIGLLLVLLMIPGLNIYPGSPQAGKSLPDRAFALQQAAVESQKQGELIRAEEQFKQAIDLYHRALKSFEISWNPEFNRNRLFCIESLKKLVEKRNVESGELAKGI